MKNCTDINCKFFAFLFEKNCRIEFDVEILAEINAELSRADKKHGPMGGKIEGLYTLRCEVEELSREVMKESHDPKSMRKEALQVACC